MGCPCPGHKQGWVHTPQPPRKTLQTSGDRDGLTKRRHSRSQLAEPWQTLFERGGRGVLLALRPTHPKEILTQNLAEGKSNLNKRPFVTHPVPTPPRLVSFPYKQSLSRGTRNANQQSTGDNFEVTAFKWPRIKKRRGGGRGAECRSWYTKGGALALHATFRPDPPG